MAVSSHRNYVSSTQEDLERAGGRMDIAGANASDPELATACKGASIALYALAGYEIKSADDFLTIWLALYEKVRGEHE